MPKRRPKAFVGSSSEAEQTAALFCNKLRDVASVVFWKDAPEFCATTSTMDTLLNATKHYDYGFFIFTPDDRFISRGREGSMGRDNVLFEFGLFLGSLGADRVFAVVQEAEGKEEDLKIPTDLWGIQMPRFHKSTCQSDLISEIDKSTIHIREQIRQLGPKPINIRLIAGWDFDQNKQNFILRLDKERLLSAEKELKDAALCVIARMKDDTINNDEDAKIASSDFRKLPRHLTSDLVFVVETKDKIQSVEAGGFIEGYLLLIPEGCNVECISTMGEMFDAGCELLQDVGIKVDDMNS